MRRGRGRHAMPQPPEAEEMPSSSRDSGEVSIANERKLSLRRFAGARVNVENKAQNTTATVKVPVLTPQGQDAKVEIDMTPEAFQKTLRERKAEFKINAEEERLESLRQIQNRKSRIGIHPLEQFPKEIWTLILEELCPEDRLSLREVHPLFRDLTEDHRIRDILFPLIVDFIMPEKILSGRYIRRYTKKISNLRSVSKTLRNSVDNWIELRILENMKQGGNPSCLPRYKFAITSDMEWMNSLLVFSRGPIDQMPKRFVLKALEIKLWPEYWASRDWMQPRIPPEEEEDRREMLHRYFMILRNNIIEMLEKVGDQVILFQFICNSMEEMEDLGLDLSQIYSFLRECLLLMPNVKWLKLHASGLTCSPKQTKWKTSASLALQNYPLPTLAKLERVDLNLESLPIWDCILEANPQVKYFTYRDDIHGNRHDHYAEKAILSLPLETVRLGHRERMLDLKLLRRISECQWNLKLLELQVSAKDGLNLINKFPALEDLSLSVNQINFVGGISPLLLLNLKKLKVNIGPAVKFSRDQECVPFFFSFQFLFSCVQLKELVWNNLIYDSSKLRRVFKLPGNMIDFQGGLEDLRGSNVWDAFPALRRIALIFREKNSEGEMEHCTRVYCNRKLVHEDHRDWKIDYKMWSSIIL